MSWLVIGVDPGPTPGIVALTAAADREPYVIQCNRSSTRAVIHAIYADTFVQTTRRILAVERFVVGRRATRSRTPEAGTTTRNMIGVLQEVAGHINAEFIERPAGAVKPWATDIRLMEAKLLGPTRGMTHARDAARHALYAAVHAGLMPDPLLKRAATR